MKRGVRATPHHHSVHDQLLLILAILLAAAAVVAVLTDHCQLCHLRRLAAHGLCCLADRSGELIRMH
jgi:hypothetical protein